MLFFVFLVVSLVLCAQGASGELSALSVFIGFNFVSGVVRFFFNRTSAKFLC